MIKPHKYISTKLKITIDSEKVLEPSFTRLNTPAGNLLTVKFKYNTPAAGGPVDAQRVSNFMHVIIHADHTLEIHDTGVMVFDTLMM